MVNVNYYFVSTVEENVALIEEYLDGQEMARTVERRRGHSFMAREEVVQDIMEYIDAEFGDDVVAFEVVS